MIVQKIITGAIALFAMAPFCCAQLKWVNVDSLYAPLPSSVHVFKTTDSIEGKPNIAYYIIANLKDRKLDFTIDTTQHRRITPSDFFMRNNKPLLVVNCSFFSFETNSSVNVIVKNGKLLNYNSHTIPLRGKDTFLYAHPFRSAIGISKKRKVDIGWVYADTLLKTPFLSQHPFYYRDSFSFVYAPANKFQKWKAKTITGGGPVLIQNNQIKITNNEEMMFAGKAINNREPRTAMGYTADGKLIILVVQGRYTGIAEGITLVQEAEIFKQLGCVEALNLDGGGSSCLLINGKETIKPSSNGVQRPVPAVFLIQQKNK